MLGNNKKTAISRQFCQEVKELAKKYNLPFFVVTDGASATSNNGCAAVKNARDNHIKWEKENGYDPYEDWSKINKKI
jgi:pyruvate/2-oxoacid:ferredoxin oxidoreductase alpha subunit